MHTCESPACNNLRDENLYARLDPAAGPAPVVRGFLYPYFLRPLVALDGRVVRAAGFRGPPAQLAMYVATLTRVLIERCAHVDHTADLRVDLTRIPGEPDAVSAVVGHHNPLTIPSRA